MAVAMCRLAASLGLSEAPELGADSSPSQVRHQVQILAPRHIILVTAWCWQRCAFCQWSSLSIQKCLSLSSKKPLSQVTPASLLLLRSAVSLPVHQHCLESQASSSPSSGKVRRRWAVRCRSLAAVWHGLLVSGPVPFLETQTQKLLPAGGSTATSDVFLLHYRLKSSLFNWMKKVVRNFIYTLSEAHNHLLVH